jgi:hypothetical protein
LIEIFASFKQKKIELIGKASGAFFTLVNLSSSAKAISLFLYSSAAEGLVPTPPKIPK